MNNPFFTICIPTYNRGDLINRTLNSLRDQSYKTFEILIIDDGSTDDTSDRIREYKVNNSDMLINYVKKKNGGKHTALNKGIELAEGEYFVILDSDDCLLSNALERMHDLILEQNEAVGVIGKSSYKDGTILGRKFPDNKEYIDYFDFHFGSGFTIRGNQYGDCCECNKTEWLRKYSFPENDNTKFVPESYIFDRVGLEERLICTNEVFMIKEYLDDGITGNNEEFFKKNYIGFLYKYVDNIDYIMRKRRMRLLPKIFCWAKYWNTKRIDINNYGPKVSKVTLLGYIIFISLPFINFIKKKIIHNNRKLIVSQRN